MWSNVLVLGYVSGVCSGFILPLHSRVSYPGIEQLGPRVERDAQSGWALMGVFVNQNGGHRQT